MNRTLILIPPRMDQSTPSFLYKYGMNISQTLHKQIFHKLFSFTFIWHTGTTVQVRFHCFFSFFIALVV